MATLHDVEVFAIGRHNGRDYGESELYELVDGFEREQLAGKIPLKLGHTAPDTAPAAGWVTGLRVEGEKLLATFSDVADNVIQGIRDGRWRFCSIELLRDVKAAPGRFYHNLLDGIALLGSVRPAVDTLRPLNEFLSRGRPCAGVETFSTALNVDALNVDANRDDSAESARLRRENEQLRRAMHRQAIDGLIEGDVRARIVQASARESFKRVHRLDNDASYARITRNDWREFARTQPRPPASAPASHASDADTTLAPDSALVARTRDYLRDHEVRHFTLTGERLTFDRAAEIVARDVARSDPGLLRGWLDQPGTTD